MGVGPLLKSLIYVISSSLLYPVLFLLVLLIIWILLYSGSFFAEWLERVRLIKYSPEELPGLIREEGHKRFLPHRVNSYLEELRSLLDRDVKPTEVEIENLLQEISLGVWRSLDRIKMVMRTNQPRSQNFAFKIDNFR